MARRLLPTKLQPYEVQLPFSRPNSPGVDLKPVSLLLPHELFSTLHEEDHAEWEKFFGDSSARQQYWLHARDKPWYESYSLRDNVEANPDLYAPLALHGDDVASRRGLTPVTVLVCSLSSPLSWSSFSSVLLVLCVVLKYLANGSLEILYDVLRWSFDVLASGRHPATDHRGRAWPPGPRRDCAGDYLAGGVRGVICELLADWKFAKEALQLPNYYGKGDCCHECYANKSPGPGNVANQRPGAFLAHRRRTFAEYIDSFESRGVRVPNIRKFPGFTTAMLQIDLQHTDHLGVAQWLVAAALLYFANALEHPPGDWQCRYNRALRDLYFDFKEWCNRYGYESSQRQFGVAMISMSDGQQCWPEFKGKSHNTYVVGRWCASKADDLIAVEPLMTICLKKWLQAQDVIQSPRTRLSSSEAARLLDAGESFSKSWSLLAIMHAKRASPRFPLKPKHHHWQHAIHTAVRSRTNPRAHWLYKHESFVGGISKVAGAVHISTTSKRVLQRWLLRFRKRGVCNSVGLGVHSRGKAWRKLCCKNIQVTDWHARHGHDLA